MNFKKWVDSIQTADCNGVRTVAKVRDYFYCFERVKNWTYAHLFTEKDAKYLPIRVFIQFENISNSFIQNESPATHVSCS